MKCSLIQMLYTAIQFYAYLYPAGNFEILFQTFGLFMLVSFPIMLFVVS